MKNLHESSFSGRVPDGCALAGWRANGLATAVSWGSAWRGRPSLSALSVFWSRSTGRLGALSPGFPGSHRLITGFSIRRHRVRSIPPLRASPPRLSMSILYGGLMFNHWGRCWVGDALGGDPTDRKVHGSLRLPTHSCPRIPRSMLCSGNCITDSPISSSAMSWGISARAALLHGPGYGRDE